MTISINTDKSNVHSGLFVGNPLAFSDALVRLTGLEVSGLNCARAASVREILFMDPQLAREVRLIVVDEALHRELAEVCAQLSDTFRFAKIVLAYRSEERARSFIQRAKHDPALLAVSYLPMQLNMDCWLSVLRLLAHGQAYVPVELTSPAPSATEPTAVAVAVADAEQTSESTVLSGQDEIAPVNAPRRDTSAADASSTKVKLTNRELEVLRAAAQGKQNKIIAAELELSEHTVKLHMHHVIEKLGVNNRTEAAIWLLSNSAGGDQAAAS